MVKFAPAKINLGLHVVEKLSNGYHSIETVFYPVAWHDIIEVLPIKKLKTTTTKSLITNGLSIPNNNSENLIEKAFSILNEKYHLPETSFRLHKNIPIGAGLGGGSSDATTTLLALVEMYNLDISASELIEIAAKIGSDCPFFLHQKPMILNGVGKELSPISLDLSSYFILIVHPGIHVSTKEAFESIIPKKPIKSIKSIFLEPINQWQNLLVNDFENPIKQKYPVVAELLNKLKNMGALYVSMSGSGSSVYGIFEKQPEIDLSIQKMTFWSGKL